MRKSVAKFSLVVAASLAFCATASAAPIITAAPSSATLFFDLGAGIATFDAGNCTPACTPVNSANPNPTSAPSPFDAGPGTWSGKGIIASSTTSGFYATPLGDTTPYMGVLSSPANLSPEQVDLFKPATMVNLFWGSLDTYNSLQVYYLGALLATISGADVAAATGLAANGDQNTPGTLSNRLITIAGLGLIDRVVFNSTQNAFEFDNFSANAVPIPGALPLFAGGLGLLGWLARRRRQQPEMA